MWNKTSGWTKTCETDASVLDAVCWRWSWSNNKAGQDAATSLGSVAAALIVVATMVVETTLGNCADAVERVILNGRGTDFADYIQKSPSWCYSCSETESELMRFLPTGRIIADCKFTSVTVMFERTERIFDAPLEPTFYCVDTIVTFPPGKAVASFRLPFDSFQKEVEVVASCTPQCHFSAVWENILGMMKPF